MTLRVWTSSSMAADDQRLQQLHQAPRLAQHIGAPLASKPSIALENSQLSISHGLRDLGLPASCSQSTQVHLFGQCELWVWLKVVRSKDSCHVDGNHPCVFVSSLLKPPDYKLLQHMTGAASPLLYQRPAPRCRG